MRAERTNKRPRSCSVAQSACVARAASPTPQWRWRPPCARECTDLWRKTHSQFDRECADAWNDQFDGSQKRVPFDGFRPLLLSLSLSVSVYLSIYLSISISNLSLIYLSPYQSIYLSIDRSIYLSTYLPLSLSLSIYLAIYYHTIYLSHTPRTPKAESTKQPNTHDTRTHATHTHTHTHTLHSS